MSTGPYGTGAYGTLPFSTTPFYNSKTLIDAVLRDTGHSSPSTETNKRQVVLTALNNRYSTITTSKHWDWMNQELDFTFDAPYETGTVSTTKGSETLTGVGTNFSTNVAQNNKLIIGENINTIYSIESTTSLTLEGEWSDDSQTAVGYQIVKNVYTLPSDCDNIKSITLDGVGELVPLGLQEFRRRVQYNPVYVGSPQFYTVIARVPESGQILIEVYPSPDKKYNVHLSYNVNIMALTDSEDNYPLVPDRHRVVLYYGALADMYRFLSDETRAEGAEKAFKLAYLNMMNDAQITDSKVYLTTKNYRNRPRLRQSGRYNTDLFKRGY